MTSAYRASISGLLLAVTKLLLLCTQHCSCDDNIMGATANAACGPDATCKDLGGGKFGVTGMPNKPAAVVSSSYFLFGSFTASLKLQAGTTGTLATSFLVTDENEANDKNHFSIGLQLYNNPKSNQTMMRTSAVAQKMHNSALFQLPFDGSLEHHSYGIQWSKKTIFWIVDGQPMRQLSRVRRGPWPTHPLLPQVRVADDTTTAQGDLPTPPEVTTSVLKLTLLGCTTDKDAPDDQGCAGNDSVQLVWNRPMNALQMKMYNAWHYTQMMDASLGWEKNPRL